jgi:DUF1680 family protein
VGINRREVCKLLGMASLSGVSPSRTSGETASPDISVPTGVELFPLSRVRLLDSRFLHSQQLNSEYLLTLDPDRLLAWFRREAGLSPKAPVYGGWESETVWGDGYSLPGAILGFYLSAMANSYESTSDEVTRISIRKRLTYSIDQLAECQAAFGDGYLLPTKNGHQIFERVARGEIVTSNPLIDGVWEPTYVLNKITLGLYEVFQATEMEKAREVLLRAAAWFGSAIVDRLDDSQVQQLLVCEHGSLSESFIDCYRLTEDKKYLNWAKRLNDQAMLDPLSEGKDILDGWHANTQIPKFTGFHNVYLYTGQTQYRNAAFNFWQIVTQRRSWVNGGNSTGERFFPAAETMERMLASSGPESCNTVNMLRLTETLFTDSVDAKLVDYYERALYNHILPVHEPNSGMCAYFVSMRPGQYRVYSSRFESFWCCLGTGIQAASRYGSFIYARSKDAIYVNLFIPSTVDWNEMGTTIRQTTSFPDTPSTTLTIAMKESRRFSLMLRHPSWLNTDFVNVRINGQAEKISSRPGTYFALNRDWKDGDVVEFLLPMELRIERLRDSDQYASILYGPILLVGELGAKNLVESDFYQEMNHAATHTVSMRDNPVLSGTDSEVLAQLRRNESETLSFSLSSPERSEPISVVPLYRTYFQRYAIYWRIFSTETTSRQYRQALQNVDAHIVSSDMSSVDRVIAGNEKSEQAHKCEGVDCITGIDDERPWRKATKGGWFSYLVTLPQKEESCIWVEYHGAELGENQFTILIDGHSISSEKNLKKFDLPVIYGKLYRIPTELSHDKGSVTVKFQAAWPLATARIFGVKAMAWSRGSALV